MKMVGLREIIGILVCLGSPVAIVACLTWATRRPRCPHCHYAASRDAATCRHCGKSIPGV
jgi:hypothetical protein